MTHLASHQHKFSSGSRASHHPLAKVMAPLASFGFGVQAGLLLLLYVGETSALFNGNPVGSSSDVPGVIGSLFTQVTEDEASNAATCTSGDEKIVPFCTVALISPGIALTAAHCVQQQITAGDPRAIANLRVSLGRKITYQNDDGSCAGRILRTGDSIYRVKAIFWPKGFQAFTTERDGLSIAMDYMDYLVVYLDKCATSGGDSAKIAGAAFADLDQARGGGPGLNTSFWGYGENEMGQANFDGVARTATYTWTRATSRSGAAGEKNMWIDCHWLPDSASTCARPSRSQALRLPLYPRVFNQMPRADFRGLGAGGSTAKASPQ